MSGRETKPSRQEDETRGPSTRCVWGGEPKRGPEGVTVFPVFHGVTFSYDDLGAWRAVDSATEFLGGHSDALDGVVCGDASRVAALFHFREIHGHTVETVRRFLGALRLAHRAASLGSVGALVGPPATTSHVELSPEERAAAGIPETLVRYSTGIEDAEDLIADLRGALEAVGRSR